jgi:hypothetical protein
MSQPHKGKRTTPKHISGPPPIRTPCATILTKKPMVIPSAGAHFLWRHKKVNATTAMMPHSYTIKERKSM